MTIPELIDNVLASIRGQFYQDQPARNWHRDERALTKAIARWGYVCAQRGWDFDAKFIARDLLTLLNEIKRQNVEFTYLPVYLQGAVDKRVRMRAEELRAASKALPPKVTKAIAGIRPVVIVEKSGTEVLAALYRDLASAKRARRGALKRREKTSQGSLL